MNGFKSSGMWFTRLEFRRKSSKNQGGNVDFFLKGTPWVKPWCFMYLFLGSHIGLDLDHMIVMSSGMDDEFGLP
jgi:hypothetical protein